MKNNIKKVYVGFVRVCNVDGCTERHFGNGYCLKHYSRIRMHGVNGLNHGVEKRYGTPIHRLMQKIKENKETGCWEWTGLIGKGGYAQIRVDGVKKFIHRFMYEYWHESKIPNGLLVCHSCDNPKCINPEHLWLGTDKDNSQDCLKKGRFTKTDGERNPMSTISNELRISIGRDFINGKYMIKNDGYNVLVEKYGLTIHKIYSAVKWYEKYLKRRN